MANFTLFFNSFLSYLLLFILIVILGVIACFIGINLRKKKDAKDAAVQESTGNGQSRRKKRVNVFINQKSGGSRSFL